ncbi:Retrovirus-related Pol polyprotein from transposon TNT 1-94 [Artemisia annua]|uniref:Retrovirus-related Pol polyprotein from transposon TNT 1-94 n=1 Tax=Artemisia annua TaxID=35608 RepID=A0A2U1LKK4_ARTAN|nr:Retrovirus-related Pol polyprotein from transposon TNT 1-94 [Artemisia annua]
MVDGKVDKPSTSVDPTSPSWARPVLMNARLAVEVFVGTGHFGMWQSKVLDALFQQGLDIAIEESKPEDVEERNWLTINRLACGTVRSCLSREQRYAFSKETSAYKLWVALEEKFLKKNCQNKLFMKKRLFRFTYVPGTTMNDHITSFNQLVTDLMNMDEVFKDQDLALILLGSLLEEYELLETTLLNGKDDVSLSEVCAALYSKELRRKDKQISSSGDAEVLLVRGRLQKKGTDKRWRSKSRQRLSKDECAFCHEKGHWKRDCPKLKTKDNHYKRKAVAEANVTKCDDEESDLSLATSSNENASRVWLLDSACSHHITPHREWFSNFEKHEEVVYTADETPLTTHGIGSVRLQNEDGTIVTLKGVHYSPKLKKNLISVGTSESKVFEVNAKQLDGTPKKVEFERIIVSDDRGTVDDSPVVEGDYEEEEVQNEEPLQQQHESIATSKPKRNTKRPARLNDMVACASSIASDDISRAASPLQLPSRHEFAARLKKLGTEVQDPPFFDTVKITRFVDNMHPHSGNKNNHESSNQAEGKMGQPGWVDLVPVCLSLNYDELQILSIYCKLKMAVMEVMEAKIQLTSYLNSKENEGCGSYASKEI